MRALLIFIDGVGLGAADPTRNALVASPPPTITDLLGGSALVHEAAPVHAARASLVALDAQLDAPGLPQSGTGQFTLFTGINGAARFGRHYGPWVPTKLRDPLQRENLLTRAKARGRRVAFANAYPEELLAAAQRDGSFKAIGPLRSGPPLVAIGAGVLNRHTPALKLGDAVASEIINDGWREKLHRDLPDISAHTAGSNLARIANQNDLTLFAHYTTDLIGHEQDLALAIDALHRVDQFVAGVLDEIADDMIVVMASDHGNLEDASTGHTHNPALGLVIGEGHARISARMSSLLDVTPVLLELI
jgi:2,3-bisphosphoglycerate-independent phosphoglycerate mutase